MINLKIGGILAFLFVGAVQMEHFHAVDKVVDLLHKVVKENNLKRQKSIVCVSSETL